MGLLKYVGNRSSRLTPVAARGVPASIIPRDALSDPAPRKPVAGASRPSAASNSYEKRLELYIRGVNSNL